MTAAHVTTLPVMTPANVPIISRHRWRHDYAGRGGQLRTLPRSR